ncbi:PREDICTED: NAC domain-containing protein 18-like [Fragaria vesca subsp. vesca]|uniref:NAC domain-containing protein 18-like n=1 Tax=Fragaria vesca subsp. vesca TaxID=101020 RepID=UPI0002C34AB5|nr:PREDICTED: NAC domain-containing protein 18-like [Fragaria vesca subsp. vesca]
MSYGGFSLPKGFRFQPSDDELLSHYLQKKNDREDPEITAIIPEIDVSKHEPRDLPALVFTRADFLDREWFTMPDSPDMEWYFFSPRVFKHSNSKSKSTKINRTTDEGYWKKQGNDRRITGACSDKQIGARRILTFYLSNKQKTDWVIHEFYLTKADSDEQIGDFVLCRLKDNRLKKKSGKPDHDRQDAPLCDEDQAFSELGNAVVIPKGNDDEAKAEHGGSCSMASNVESPCGNDDNAELGGGSRHIVPVMLTEAEEYQGFNALQDAVFGSNSNEQEFGGSQTGPCYVDKNDHSVSIEGQPDSEMVKELLHKPVDLALPHPPPSTQLQSLIYTKSGTNNSLNDEYHKRKNPFGDSDPFLTKKNHTDEVDSNTSSNSENQPADPIPKGCSQPGGNLESDLFRSQKPPSIIREPRDLPHDNDFIEWVDLPSITELIEGF